jgi:rod shape-determining protein MreC
LPVGVVEKVVPDPDRDSFIDIIVKPAAHLERLDEVLVITSTEPRFSPQEEQDIAASDSQKDVVPTAIKDQVKASEIMAEKLPGLIDPNLPPDKQPLNDTSNPNPAPPPPQPLHADQFSPSAATTPATAPRPETDTEPAAPKPQTQKPATPHATGGTGSKPQSAEVSKPQSTPRRNP